MTARHRPLHRSQLLFSLFLLSITAGDVRSEDVEFVRDVFPILETYCVGCHNVDDAQGGLSMDNHQALIRGGDSGAALTAGVPDSSRMLMMASGKLKPVMPPDDAEGPSPEELEVLARWIEQGAVGPDGPMPIKRKLRTPEIPAASNAKPITAIAVSSEGNRTARARFAQVEIVDSDGAVITIIPSEDLGKVNELTFSTDGQRLLVASGLTGAYGRAAVYDAGSGDLIREYVGHSDTLYAAKFSPDESLIATAGYDRKVLLWDVSTGKVVRELLGHNGAIFDLAFSPDGRILVSACADETAKVWNVSSGERLDTLSQPEGEVSAVAVTADGKHVVAASGDNRIRVWRLLSIDRPVINPLVATRFVDETPIVNIALSPDGHVLVAVAQSGSVKVLRTSDWQPTETLQPLDATGTDLFISQDSRQVNISLMNGELVTRELPRIQPASAGDTGGLTQVWMDLGEPLTLDETMLRERVMKNLSAVKTTADADAASLDVERNVVVNGLISSPGEVDLYRWRAAQGEVWAIDADAAVGGRLDPIVTVLDASGRAVSRVRLQAVRDSYFTFRGKDSEQFGDFRMFNWQEMRLGEYLFAAGEVTRLQVHPRGPDSGFNVYPSEGKRWTYFGTSGTTHALGEPAYVVRPLPRGAEPLANGLPVFDIVYENDDDPRRMHGKNSRLLFTAPEDGLYSVRVTDTRGEGGPDYGYQLKIRAAEPGFQPSVEKVTKPLHPGSGREFNVRVDRIDGYEGPVTFDLNGLPERLVSNFPITIEAGQRYATGVIWADENESGWDPPFEPKLVASATINGTLVERDAGTVGPIRFDTTAAQVVPAITSVDATGTGNENWTLRVRRGETVSARVSIKRNGKFKGEVSFGKEFSGRNASQGVYVDNIGLNGLLILADQSEREFFVTADPTTEPGKRSFFLTANVDGGISTHPIIIEVLP